MCSSNNLPWMEINDFLVDVGSMRDPKAFCVQVVQKIYPLIPYDQARVYFINDMGEIYDEVLMGVDEMWSDIYLQYFSKIDGGRYAIPTRSHMTPTKTKNGRYAFPEFGGSVYDWTNYEFENAEFANEYIQPQKINHSAGFAFHSADNFTKSVYILDRTSQSGYAQQEISIMSIIQPHLDNLHKNLFVLAQSNSCAARSCVQKSLTKRELEIAELLCDGFTPTKISHSLFISLSTVYRHIANIHKKLNVSNRQELLLKLIDA
ncbi:MAG: hypothetical protein H6660_02705 [Ardenticatenaceae bacterium]|nr:hypothetical protein [Ardenticatenaceae bacterium]